MENVSFFFNYGEEFDWLHDFRWALIFFRIWNAVLQVLLAFKVLIEK